MDHRASGEKKKYNELYYLYPLSDIIWVIKPKGLVGRCVAHH
jgi:hypothetical protein